MITPDLFGIMRRAARRAGQEVRLAICRDRQGELPELQIGQRHTQNAGVRNADRIERDIDAPNPADHRLQMRIDGLLVQRIDVRGHRGSARRNNVLGQRIDGRPISTGEEKRDPLIGGGTRDGATDAPRGAVHNGDLVLQHGDTDTGDRIRTFTRFEASVLPWFGLPQSLADR
jgi:hypothetical protein